MSAPEFGVLLLGPESCGKTLLLKSLQYYSSHGRVWDFGSVPRHGRPTLGVELVNFTLPLNYSGHSKKRNAAKKQNTVNIVLRELGGQMWPLWCTYFVEGQCDALIYCIDSLNSFQASRASVELAGILNNSKLRETVKSILIVFTKSADLDAKLDSNEISGQKESAGSDSTEMSVVELRSMMMLDDILEESRQFISSIDILTKCSSVTGVGLSEIFAWLEKTARN